MASEDEWNDPETLTDGGGSFPVGFSVFGFIIVSFAIAMSILGEHAIAFGYMALLTGFMMTLIFAATVASAGGGA